jgi:raffinose/stachyose/melibiose transport system permease protein
VFTALSRKKADQIGKVGTKRNLDFFKFSNFNYKTQRKIMIIAFLFLPLTLLCIFSYYPAANLFYLSLMEWDGISKTKDFVGLKNYVTLFTNPEYFIVFRTSLYYLAGSFIQLALALYFATILSFKVKFKNFFKGVLFFPYLLNGVAIGLIFIFFFRPTGTLDSVLDLIGLGNFQMKWLGNPKIVNISLVGASIWRYMGYMFVLFLGSIQSVPAELYEAAEIDGANRWHQFRFIILPTIWRVIELNMILAISGSISAFEMPYIMTGGSNGSMTFVIKTVETAFKWKKFGLASAMGCVLLFIVIIVTMIQKKFFAEKEAID